MAKQAEQQNTKIIQAEAHARFIRLSPRKARLVTNLVKNMWATDALTQLQFTNKKSAKYVYDLIKSAMANAENNFKLKKENLFVKTITCDSGPKLKRFMPRAQGRATPMRRPTTHMHVLLEERQSNRKVKANLPKGRKEKSETNAQPADINESTEQKNLPNKKQGGRSQIDKTGEQDKANKVTQKRRLFNRKSGV